MLSYQGSAELKSRFCGHVARHAYAYAASARKLHWSKISDKLVELMRAA